MKRFDQIIHTWMFAGMSYEKMFPLIASTGAAGVDLTVRFDGFHTCEEVLRDAAANKQILQDAGLKVPVVTPFYFNAETELCSEDPKVRRCGIDFSKRCVDIAAEYGATRLLVSPSWISPVHKLTLPYEDHLKLAAESLAELSDYAAQAGAGFMIEPVNRYRVSLIHTVTEAKRLIAMTGKENLYIVPDVFHMHVEEPEGIVNAIHEAGGALLQCLHIGDNTRRCPGYGTMDWRGILSALKIIDFAGALSYEPAQLYFSEKMVENDDDYAAAFAQRLKNGIAYLDHLMDLI